MPIGNNYLTQKTVRLIMVCAAYIMIVSMAHAQSLNCRSGLNASLDDSCRVVIQASTILASVPPLYDSSDWELTVTANPGSDLSGVYYLSGDSLIQGGIGSVIVFTQTGSYKVSVNRRGTAQPCWGYFTVEDKLPPLLVDGTCDCPEDATVVSEECTFSCASIDEIYNQSDRVVTYDSIYQCLEQEKRATGQKKLVKVPSTKGDSVWTYFDVYDWVCVRDTAYRVLSGEVSCKYLPEAQKLDSTTLRPVISLSADHRCISKADSIRHNPTENLNPVFFDNCGNIDDIFHRDELVAAPDCGEWFIYRRWYTNIYTTKGVIEKQLACTQKFLFQKIENNVRPPRQLVTVQCGTDTSPESLRRYFSNNPTPGQHDSVAIWSSSPYIVDTLANDTVVYHPLGIRGNDTEKYCKVLSAYTDHKTIYPDDNCKHHYKFVREWKWVDWCTGVTEIATQLIVVNDTLAPSFTLSDTLLMSSTDPWRCESDHPVPAPVKLYDNCTDASNITWRAKVISGYHIIVADASNGYRLRGLHPGKHYITYEVEDGCGNMSSKTATLKLIDKVSPNVTTKDVVHVTFTEYGSECTAKIYPKNIDLGSFDACDPVIDLHIRRLGDDVWADFVKFSESDLTSVSPEGIPYGEVKIELRARDQSGNVSLGWSTARLEDKHTTVISNCGSVAIDLTCSSDINDIVAHPDYAPTTLFRSCSDNYITLEHVFLSKNMREKCNTGHARVAYIIPGTNDTVCIKDFYLKNNNDITIKWPAEELTIECEADITDKPVVLGAECNSIVQSIDSQEFEAKRGFGYCKKIIRKYTIIDWCTYQPNGYNDKGIHRFTQVIKVKDSHKPVVTCSDQSFNAEEDCGLRDVVLNASVVDSTSCNEQIKWAANVDIDRDGIYEYALAPSINEDGTVSAVVDTLLLSGEYSVRWVATDACQNVGVQVCKIAIIDTKAPQTQCIDAISTALMNTGGELTIHAKNFNTDNTKTDECGGQIWYSFSEDDKTQTTHTLSCEDISNGINDTIELRVYVWDQFDNTDFCTVKIHVSDNSDVCPDIAEGSALISGKVATAKGYSMESAEVIINDMNMHNETLHTTAGDGSYAFGSNPLYHDFEVSVYKDDLASSGVSTRDLIMIKQHILAIELLDTPYKVIAADVSGDKIISGKDLVEIRRVILGLQEDFSAGDSWTFVASDQVFEDPLSPWPYAKNDYISSITKNQRAIDFIAVKLGDVDGSAIPNRSTINTRSDKRVKMYLDDQQLNMGAETTFALTIPTPNIAGLQMALSYRDISISDIAVYGLPLSADKYRITSDHIILSLDEIASSADHLTISITGTALANQQLSEMISIDHTFLAAEIYHGTEISTSSLVLEKEQAEKAEGFVLHQNVPNPFTDETVISYTLEHDGQVELSVFNVAGELLLQQSSYGYKGYNKLTIDPTLLPASGVMYYQLSTGDQLATKKMIRL